MEIPKIKHGTRVRVLHCSKKPNLVGQRGTVVCHFENTVLLYGVAFDRWNDGHSLRIAPPETKPEPHSYLIGKRNCEWLSSNELQVESNE